MAVADLPLDLHSLPVGVAKVPSAAGEGCQVEHILGDTVAFVPDTAVVVAVADSVEAAAAAARAADGGTAGVAATEVAVHHTEVASHSDGCSTQAEWAAVSDTQM